MLSFGQVMRVLSLVLRTDDGLKVFMRDRANLRKVLTASEELQDERMVGHAMRIIRLNLRDEDSVNRLFSDYPNILTYLFWALGAFRNNESTMYDCLLSIRYATRYPHLMDTVTRETVRTVYKLENEPIAERCRAHLDYIKAQFSARPKLRTKMLEGGID